MDCVWCDATEAVEAVKEGDVMEAVGDAVNAAQGVKQAFEGAKDIVDFATTDCMTRPTALSLSLCLMCCTHCPLPPSVLCSGCAGGGRRGAGGGWCTGR
jgi:hypothetical protein